MLPPFNYVMPTRIVFGRGCIRELATQAAHLGRRPFLVTGKRSARASGILNQVLEQVPTAVVYDAIEENPSTAACEQAAAVCRESQCEFVIGLGGGSPMDAAKAVAGLAINEGRGIEYIGTDKFVSGALPIVAIPTTAGTGSEVTPYAVMVDPDTNTKRTISGAALFPKVALLDPELTVTMPRHVTINTGLDALSQAMEGMVSLKSTPIGELFALEICGIVHRWLPLAADEPENLDARAQMLYAAMLSGCVIAQSGTTLVHGMGYYYTLEFNVAHGLANALLLPPVFAYNAHYRPEQVAALAAALGHPSPPAPEPAATAVSQALYELFARLGVSPAARDQGVAHERLAWCAEEVFNDRSRFKNQVGKPSAGDVRQFFENSYEGTVDVTTGSAGA
jgi:alcohol dehydrogenase class IV